MNIWVWPGRNSEVRYELIEGIKESLSHTISSGERIWSPELSVKARKMISSCFYFFVSDNILKEVIHLDG